MPESASPETDEEWDAHGGGGLVGEGCCCCCVEMG